MKKSVLCLLVLLPFSLAAQWDMVRVFDGESPSINQYRLQVINAETVLMYPEMTYYDSTIKRSIDGGETWESYALPASAVGTVLYEADFVNDSVGYLVGGTPYGGWNVILKTVDGGMNWTTIDNYFLVGSAPYSMSIQNVDFIDANTGYIVSFGNGLYKTTDGGQTFNQIQLPDSYPAFHPWITEIRFVNQNEGFAAFLGYRPSDSTYVSYIQRTMDGGLNWSIVDAKNWTWTNDWHKVDKMEFVNSNDGFAIGGRGLIKVTTNGGADWLEKDLPLSDAMATDLDFVNNSCGYIILDHQIYRTDDAGNTWSLQSIVSDSPNVHYLQFANDSIGYAAGNYYLFENPFTTLFKTEQMPGVPLSTPGNALFAQIKIYPNPSNGFINLAYGKNIQVLNIQLIDISGRKIRAYRKREKRLDLTGISSGIYFLDILTDQGKLCKKLIIQ